ncbi:T9SS type A sorting domain-containing protein [Roseivirga sp. BDSF3-8]|uniref:T9SS type A sorting domain-containing protein n=1 Tax=Roseivirga sp. BDSF3-8 TaxID=3241598 RepID=UPI0035320972
MKFNKLFLCLCVGFAFTVETLHAQTCTTIANGDWSDASTWSCTGGVRNPPVGTWNGVELIINHDIYIGNNDVINMSFSSTMSKLTITSGSTLVFRSNSQLRLPSGSQVVLEEGAEIYAANNSRSTLIEIGGNGVWGRDCEAEGCTNGVLTGPGTMDENSNPNDPLPVDLLFFDANLIGNNVQLRWATTSEYNNSHFIIEKAGANLQFSEAGRIEGVGDSDVLLNYSFTDRSPISGVSYYRLVQVDLDGSTEISRTVAIHSSFINAGVKIFPNPSVGGSISLEYYHPEVNSLKVTYMDATGRVVYKEEVTEPIGSRVELGKDINLEKGLYEVHILLDNLVYVKRLLVN